jgi:hypothetical protein
MGSRERPIDADDAGVFSGAMGESSVVTAIGHSLELSRDARSD